MIGPEYTTLHPLMFVIPIGLIAIIAFEANGLFHYEPIFGQDKLDKIVNNDSRKFQACLEHNIELCLIDTSMQINFKEKSSKKYLNVITKLVDNKLLQP